MYIISIIAGFFLLVVGAEFLVKGASRLAAAARVTPLVIGLTVVAFGTSSPEMAVSLFASLKGQTDVAIGNVIGSNIFNILFILGVTAVITPLTVARQLIRLDVPIMIFASVVTWMMAAGGYISRLEGLALFIGIIVYTVFLIFKGRKDHSFVTASIKGSPATVKDIALSTLSVIAGLVLLVVGSRLLVNGAVQLATILGVSSLVIGLTIVAVGTSLPEAATSIVAGIRGERDIAVGNIVGSNIFNILAVLGISALVSGNGMAVSGEVLIFDIPVMVATAMICLPVFYTKGEISRWEGVIFVAYYIIYISVLIMKTKGLETIGPLKGIIAYIALPLTAIVFLISLMRSAKKLEGVSRIYLSHARKLIIFVIGMTVLVIGFVMIFMPGPAIVFIPLGLAILGTEFVWAKRLLGKARQLAENTSQKITGILND